MPKPQQQQLDAQNQEDADMVAEDDAGQQQQGADIDQEQGQADSIFSNQISHQNNKKSHEAGGIDQEFWLVSMPFKKEIGHHIDVYQSQCCLIN